MRKVSSIVVTYNRKELLKECISSLLISSYKCDILIIDNNSSDGTYEYIKSFIDNIHVFYFNTKKNIGGAGGFNYGMKKALSMGYEYMWLMDDDVMVEKNSLKELMDASSLLKENYGFLSSYVYWIDKSRCEMNKQKYKDKYLDSKLCLDYKILKVYHSTFVSFFIKSSVVRDVGFPIKEFFIWGDDVEYTNRIDKKYDCYLVKKSRVLHKTKNNCGSNITYDNDRIDRYKYAYRNEMYIARCNGIKGILRQLLKICYHIVRVLFLSKKYKFKKIKLIVSSSIKGIKFNPSIEYVGECND